MNIFEFFGDKKLMEEFKPKILKPLRKKIEHVETPIVIENEDHIKGYSKVIVEKYNMNSVEDSLSSFDFKGSSVRRANIEGIEIEKLSYWGIIRGIYEFLGDVEHIVENSQLSIVEGKYTEKGYVWIKELDISVQGVTSDRSVKEIFKQILENRLTFFMEIDKYPKRWVFMNE